MANMGLFMRTLGVIAFCSVATAVSMAGTIEPCTTQSLASYLTATSVCDISGFLFGDFYYNPTSLGGGPIVTAADVTVTPIFGADPGLTFSATWTGTGNSGTDSEIGYHMASANGLPLIFETTLAMTSVSTGSANAVLDEFVCVGGTFSGLCATNPGDVVEAQLSEGVGTLPQNPAILFGPVSNISVLKDVRAFGNGSGSTTISSITNQFPAPEPVSCLLTLSGFILLGVRKFRRS